MKRFASAIAVLFVASGVTWADEELNVFITGVKDGQVSFKQNKDGKAFGAEKTIYASRDVRVIFGAVAKKGKEITVEGEFLDDGLESPFFKKAAATTPMAARVYLDDAESSKQFGIGNWFSLPWQTLISSLLTVSCHFS